MTRREKLPGGNEIFCHLCLMQNQIMGTLSKMEKKKKIQGSPFFFKTSTNCDI